MPFHVRSNTGHVFYPEEGVAVHPTEATVVDELTPAMEFQRVNLRIDEVDDEGNPVNAPTPSAPETVDRAQYENAIAQRDEFQAKADKAHADAEKAKEKHEEALKALREKHETDLKDAKTEAERAGAEAVAKVATLESLLPTGKTQLGLYKPEQLKALAEYRGVKVEGEDKSAYVDALTKGE